MKIIWALTILLVVSFQKAIAQKPYSWSFTINKAADKTFDVHCVAKLVFPWHIYSQFTPEGGPLPTRIEFHKNPLVIVDGKIKEEGKMVVKKEPAFGIEVWFYEERVEFIQKLKLRTPSKTNIAGWVEFMICKEDQCLPPTKENFSLEIN